MAEAVRLLVEPPSAVMISFIRRDSAFTPVKLPKAFESGAQVAVTVAMAVASAGLTIGCLFLSGKRHIAALARQARQGCLSPRQRERGWQRLSGRERGLSMRSLLRWASLAVFVGVLSLLGRARLHLSNFNRFFVILLALSVLTALIFLWTADEARQHD